MTKKKQQEDHLIAPKLEQFQKQLRKAQEKIKTALKMLDERKINVWLDDVRTKPASFDVWVKTPEEAIDLLKQNIVGHISLDHDLGLEPDTRNGYMVASWIEEHAYIGDLVPLSWNVHSQNSVGRDKMSQALMNADKFWSSKRDNHPETKQGSIVVKAFAFSREDWVDRVREDLGGALGEFAKIKYGAVADIKDFWSHEVQRLLVRVHNYLDWKAVKTKTNFNRKKAFEEAALEASLYQNQVTTARNEILRLIDENELGWEAKRRVLETHLDATELLDEMIMEYIIM